MADGANARMREEMHQERLTRLRPVAIAPARDEHMAGLHELDLTIGPNTSTNIPMNVGELAALRDKIDGYLAAIALRDAEGADRG